MVTDQHICPFGLKSLDLLEREGFAVDDHRLTSRADADTFMAEQHVQTTPQTFIAGKRIGGYDDLRRYLGKPIRDPSAVTYQPGIAVFGMAALMALAANWASFSTLFSVRAGEWFIAFSMSNMFLGYDLLAQRLVRYAYIYPFAEALAGILMIAGVMMWVSVPVALFIGGIGAISVFKAVYIDKRELKRWRRQ